MFTLQKKDLFLKKIKISFGELKILLCLQTNYEVYLVMAYSLSYSKSILVLAFISDKIRRGETDYISTKVMSEVLNIPKPTLSVIFNNLIRAGIIESKEGINGGVRFAKNAEQITLLDILSAIENQKPLFQTSFELNVNTKRPEALKNAVTNALNNAESVMKATLSKTTLKDILNAE